MAWSRWFVGLWLFALCACSSGGSSGGAGGSAGASAGGAGGTGASPGGGVGGTGASPGGGVGGTGASPGGGASGRGGGGVGGQAGDASSDGGGEPVIEMVTSMGPMVFQLDSKNMPITTVNFLAYVDEGFFNGTIIHRVIPDFVIQGGGYTSGLQPKATHPPIVLETSPAIVHDYGVISMARTSNPDSATSQFFVVNATGGAHSLDGQYAAFGRLIDGSVELDAISAVPTSSQSGFDDVPVTEIVVSSVTRK